MYLKKVSALKTRQASLLGENLQQLNIKFPTNVLEQAEAIENQLLALSQK